MPSTIPMTDTDDQMKVVLQSVENGMVRCLYKTWEKQQACFLAVKSDCDERCMYYFGSLNHCWLPEYKD